jgi:glucose/arabinose dehydrogenase
MRPCLRVVAIAALTLLVALATSARAQLQGQLVVSGLSSPLGFVQNPADPSMQVIVEQGGRLRVLLNGTLLPTDFLNLSGQIAFNGEQGLLGFVFAPDYATSGRVFVNFTNPDGHTVLARFERSSVDPLQIDPATRFDFVWPGGDAFISQPFGNHNGGHMAFGPDGYMYVGLGDGGSGSDPFNLVGGRRLFVKKNFDRTGRKLELFDQKPLHRFGIIGRPFGRTEPRIAININPDDQSPIRGASRDRAEN